MSLGDFLMDDTLGGGVSWANDDFDITEFNRGAQSSNRHVSHGQNQKSASIDFDGPMVLVMNLPNDADDKLVDDLFKSRFFKYSNCQVFQDPHSPRMKVAVVTLNSNRDVENVIKWKPIPLDGLKITFRYCDSESLNDIQRWNDENKVKTPTVSKELPKLPVKSTKPKVNPFGNAKPVNNSAILDSPIISENTSELKRISVHQQQQPTVPTGEDASTPSPTTSPKILQRPNKEKAPVVEAPKSNPFGSAKPVDTLSRQLEIERKLKLGVVNSTTISTKKIHDLEKQQKRQRDKLEKQKQMAEMEKVRLEKEILEKQGFEEEVERLKREKQEKESAVKSDVKAPGGKKRLNKNTKKKSELKAKILKENETKESMQTEVEIKEVSQESKGGMGSKLPKGPKSFKSKSKPKVKEKEKTEVIVVEKSNGKEPRIHAIGKEESIPSASEGKEAVIKKGKLVEGKLQKKARKVVKKQEEKKKKDSPADAVAIATVESTEVPEGKSRKPHSEKGYLGKHFDPNYKKKKPKEKERLASVNVNNL